MSRLYFRSTDIVVASMVGSLGEVLPALSIRTRRRAWLPDVVILSAEEARQVGAALGRATFYLPVRP